MDAREPVATPPVEPDPDQDTIARIRRRVGPAERAVLAAAAATFALFATTQVRGEIEQRKAQSHFLDRYAHEAAQTTPEQRAFLGRSAELARGLAAGTWEGDVVTPRAAELLTSPGVYLRVTSARLGSDDEVFRATEESTKDALATCLMLGATPADESDAGPCEPGTACLGDRSGKLSNMRLVTRGLFPFTAAWEARARSASGLELGVLESELASRVDNHLARAKAVVDSAAYVLVVVDEVPAGTQMPWYSTGLATMQQVDHPVRVGLFDTRSGAAVAKVRVFANAASANAPHERGAVARQVQGCTLGLDLAARLQSAAPLRPTLCAAGYVAVGSRPMRRLACLFVIAGALAACAGGASNTGDDGSGDQGAGGSDGSAGSDAAGAAGSGANGGSSGTGGAGGKGGSGGSGGTVGGSAGAAGASAAGGGAAGKAGTAGAGGSGTAGVGGSGTAGSGTAGSGTAGSGTAGSGTAGSGTAGSGTAGSSSGGACTPTASTCSGATPKCGLVGNGFGCVAAGTTPDLGACMATGAADSCMADDVCDGSSTPSVCRHFCDPSKMSSDCPTTQSCTLTITESTGQMFSVCVPQMASCDPGLQDCPGNQACAPGASGTSCGAPGTTADGAACNAPTACMKGSGCFALNGGAQVCHHLCNPKAPSCPSGTCTMLTGKTWGVCNLASGTNPRSHVGARSACIVSCRWAARASFSTSFTVSRDACDGRPGLPEAYPASHAVGAQLRHRRRWTCSTRSASCAAIAGEPHTSACSWPSSAHCPSSWK